MAKKRVVTIAREAGTGGFEIGKKLAEALDWGFYHKEILRNAAKESGLRESILEAMDERPKSLLYSLVMDPYSIHSMTSYDTLEQNASAAIYEAIRKAAEEEPCVIVGRCADYILRDRDDVLKIFITAPKDYCAERVMEYYDFTKERALDYIKKKNKRRASYYNYYSNCRWEDVSNYHICIDSSVLGIDGTAELIKDILAKAE